MYSAGRRQGENGHHHLPFLSTGKRTWRPSGYIPLLLSRLLFFRQEAISRQAFDAFEGKIRVMCHGPREVVGTELLFGIETFAREDTEPNE